MRYRALSSLALLLLAGCDQLAPRQPQTSAKSGTLAGRFTIIHSPHIQRDTMLLDTATGETWQLVTKGKSEDSALTWERVEMAEPLPAVNLN